MTSADILRGDWQAARRRLRLADGRSLAYVDTGGPGKPWLLVHGYSDSGLSFAPLLPHLKGIRLIMPDLPGHGGSDPLPALSLKALAADMVALCASLRLSPRLVAGHSLGSLVALTLAADAAFPGMRTVLIAGTARPAEGGLGFLDAIDGFADPPGEGDPFFDDWYRGPRPVDPALIAALRREAGRMPKAVWLACRALLGTVDLRPRLAGLATPVLALSGRLDPIFPPAHADGLAKGIPGLLDIRLDGLGHNPHWEDPARIATLMRDFAR